jgi:hypothetical protein
MQPPHEDIVTFGWAKLSGQATYKRGGGQIKVSRNLPVSFFD